MQEYWPIIQSMFWEGYRFTLDNAAYAGVLTVSVWLLTAIFYSIRIAFVNSKHAKLRQQIQNKVDTAQQQIQQLQDELAASAEQLEKEQASAENESQRATKLELQMIRRNNQLAENIKTLASRFNLPEPVLSSADDVDAEAVWQGHDALISQLSDLFRTEQQAKVESQQAYQAEVEKLAAKEAQLVPMQARLDIQLDRILKLEAAAEEHKDQLLQQQDRAQQRLAEAVEQHQADLARLAELEKQALEWRHGSQHLPKQQEKTNIAEVVAAQPQHDEPSVSIASLAQPVEPPKVVQVKPVPVVAVNTQAEITEPAAVKMEPTVSSQLEQAGGAGSKFKSLFSNAKQQFAKMDRKFGGQSAPVELAEQESELQQPEQVVKVEMPEAMVIDNEPQLDEVKAQKAGIAKTFKNLFAKPAAPVDDLAHADVVEPSPVELAAEEEPIVLEIQPELPKPRAGALKGLLGKWGANRK